MEELLHKAIENGDEAEVRNLIKRGAAMDKLMGLRGTALCAAIADNKTSIAFYLIEAGCDVNGEDYDREPPLLLAMRKERLDIIKRLVSHPKCDLNKADPLTKLTPLCFAAKFGQEEVIKWLVTAGCQLVGKDSNGNTALHLAIAGSHYGIIEYLVQKGCSLVEFNDEGFTPMHALGRKGDYKNLITILSKWVPIEDNFPKKFAKIKMSETQSSKILNFVDINTKYTNETPLQIAAKDGHSNLIKILLMCGANPNLTNFTNSDTSLVQMRSYQSTPLMELILCLWYKTGHIDLDIIKWLLDAGSLVNVTAIEREKIITTPLGFAIRNDFDDLARLLVAYKANLSLNSKDNAPLYDAILNNSWRVMWYFLNECDDIRYTEASGLKNRNYFHVASSLSGDTMDRVMNKLLSKNCSVNSTDDSLQTPLMLGIKAQNVQFVRKIISFGADVSICDIHSNTPLHLASEIGSVEITKNLLVYGADLDAINSNNRSPLDIALFHHYYGSKCHTEIAVLLLQNGCHVSNSAISNNDSEDAVQNYVEDDSDDSDSSLSSSDSSEDLDFIVKDLLQKRLNNPPSLFMLTVAEIRKHFRQNVLPFSGIVSLPLPKSIIDLILLK